MVLRGFDGRFRFVRGIADVRESPFGLGSAAGEARCDEGGWLAERFSVLGLAAGEVDVRASPLEALRISLLGGTSCSAVTARAAAKTDVPATTAMTRRISF